MEISKKQYKVLKMKELLNKGFGKGGLGNRGNSNTVIEDEDTDDIHMDAVIGSVVEQIIVNKSMYYEDIFNKFLLNIDLTKNQTIFKDVGEYILYTLLNPFNPHFSPSMVNKFSYKQMM